MNLGIITTSNRLKMYYRLSIRYLVTTHFFIILYNNAKFFIFIILY